MKFTALTAALVITFASAQEFDSAVPEITGVPSGAPRPTGVRPPVASGFRPSSHKGVPWRPTGTSGFAHSSGAARPTGLPDFSGFPSGVAPSGHWPVSAGFPGHQQGGFAHPSGSGRPESPSGDASASGRPLPTGFPLSNFPSDIPNPISSVDAIPSGAASPDLERRLESSFARPAFSAHPEHPSGAAPSGFPSGHARGSGRPRPTGGFGGQRPHGNKGSFPGFSGQSGLAQPTGGHGGFGGKPSGAGGARPTAAPSFGGEQGAAPSGGFGGFHGGSAAAPSGFQTLRRV